MKILKIKVLLTFSGIFAGCLINQAGFADNLQMRETLTRIERLLNQVNPLINLAESQQDNDTRVKFQFEVLRQDVSNVKFGIDQALRRVTIQPRVVGSLSGDYLPVSQSLSNTDKSELKEDESS